MKRGAEVMEAMEGVYILVTLGALGDLKSVRLM